MQVLKGLKVLEFAAIGPVPWAVDLLIDHGAVVTRVCNPKQKEKWSAKQSAHDRKRNDVFLDLQNASDRKALYNLIEEHELLVEGMRPGVLERLGVSTDICHRINSALVYVRVTGWGQKGPFAKHAGHDLNYIALSGALHSIGPEKGGPVVPLNLIGDYGSGSAFMLFGAMAALLFARQTGQGSVVDVAMLDGVIRQLNNVYQWHSQGAWRDKRGSNFIDGGAPWYDVYATKCGRYVAVAALEDKFYRNLLVGLGLDTYSLPERSDKKNHQLIREIFTRKFKEKSQSEWEEIFNQLDACVSPVLSLHDAPKHLHNQSREMFTKTVDGKEIVSSRRVPIIEPLSRHRCL